MNEDLYSGVSELLGDVSKASLARTSATPWRSEACTTTRTTTRTTPRATSRAISSVIPCATDCTDLSSEYLRPELKVTFDHLSAPRVEAVLGREFVARYPARLTRKNTFTEPRDCKSFASYAATLGLVVQQPLHASASMDEQETLHTRQSAAQDAAQNVAEEKPPDPESLLPKFPTKRRPEKRELSNALQGQIDPWFTTTGVKLAPLKHEQLNAVKLLLYTYQDLNSLELEDLEPTNLYVHRVRLNKGTPSWNKPRQRRWPPGKEFWLGRIIN